MANYQLSKTGAEIDAALDLAITHEITKANVDGNYPDLTAGDAVHSTNADFASQIETDREIDDAEEACPPIVFGTVGGNAEVQSGLMKFPELRGHTIKWNQLVQNGNFESLVGWSEPTYGTMSISDGKASYTVTTVGDEYQNRIATSSTKFVKDHKYLICCTVTPPANKSYTIRAVAYGNGHYLFTTAIIGTVSSRGFIGVIVTSAYSESTQLRFTMGSVSKAVDDVIVFENCECFDLTDIYGAGKEPSTVAEFVRDYSLPYYAYNAGTLLSSKSASLISRGRNQWDEEWELGSITDASGSDYERDDCIRSKGYMRALPSTVYCMTIGATDSGVFSYVHFYDANKINIGMETLKQAVGENTFTTPEGCAYIRFYIAADYGDTYNNDVCIYVNWETPNLPYVAYEQQTITLPNIELRSAGSAYDVLYQQGGGKRRIGVVDLGTIAWDTAAVAGSDTTIHRFVSTGVIAKGVGGYGTVLGNGICSHYDLVTNEQSFNKVLGIAITQTGRLSVYDTSKNTMTSSEFKAAMSGVVLYYELATETDITTTENPGWDDEYLLVDNFGTLIFGAGSSQVPQVPQAYFIRYTVNPVEFLDSVGEKAGWDADAIVLKSDIPIPDAPTTDGTYTLKVTVSNGSLVYSWVADEE